MAPMVAALDDPELAPLAVEALSKTILMFGEKFDVEEEMNAGNAFAKACDGELGRGRVVHLGTQTTSLRHRLPGRNQISHFTRWQRSRTHATGFMIAKRQATHSQKQVMESWAETGWFTLEAQKCPRSTRCVSSR